MQAGDPRADPTVVDLIELAGQWLAAGDLSAMARTLRRLDDELSRGFPEHGAFIQRFRSLLEEVQQASGERSSAEELLRTYRRAAVG